MQDVPIALHLLPGEEVEYGSVVPKVIKACGLPGKQILCDPGDSGVVADPLTAGTQSSVRDVENGQIGEAPGEQSIH
jgi:hypothetical protein